MAGDDINVLAVRADCCQCPWLGAEPPESVDPSCPNLKQNSGGHVVNFSKDGS